MNEMQIFSNPAFGQVRVSIDASNQPIFCLADICGVLGVSNVGNVKSRLDEDDIRQEDSIDSIGRTQKILYVTEEAFMMWLYVATAQRQNLSESGLLTKFFHPSARQVSTTQMYQVQH